MKSKHKIRINIEFSVEHCKSGALLTLDDKDVTDSIALTLLKDKVLDFVKEECGSIDNRTSISPTEIKVDCLLVV